MIKRRIAKVLDLWTELHLNCTEKHSLVSSIVWFHSLPLSLWQRQTVRTAF